ncbi:unnamed protein product [Nippostrongylus brasiliensis]|uniref:Ion_trans_2 domain-containing protein n=1 Tax=Nippostrongylus brasiliensis TaxID=27835 RepID=A0A158QXM6_NIPBR|nr:unnamed protein product [Nippostrongylus brasiliensis]
MVKLDAKRSELLNVLWAETISKPEADWAEMANQKLELYEKALLNYLGYHDETHDRSFMGSLRKSFSLVTTIVIEVWTSDMLVFGVVQRCSVMFVGIITMWSYDHLYMGGKFELTDFTCGKALVLPVAGFIFVSAVIYDIIEDGGDDVPFIDAMFSIFLQYSAIGETDSEFHGILPYTLAVIGVALMSVVFVQMEHVIERSLHGLEFTFSKFFSSFERWMSEDKGTAMNSNRIEEEDEEESDY